LDDRLRERQQDLRLRLSSPPPKKPEKKKPPRKRKRRKRRKKAPKKRKLRIPPLCSLHGPKQQRPSGEWRCVKCNRRNCRNYYRRKRRRPEALREQTSLGLGSTLHGCNG
jgi:hypothetical protein